MIPPPPLKLGIVSRTATYEPFYILEAEGRVELVELGSTAAGVDALVAGLIEIAATCPDALIASDAPLRIGAGLVDRPPTSIVARAGIGAIADLRGRRVGTTAAHGSVSIFLHAVLRAHGLERGDYTEVVLGPTPAQAEALERGEIDAAMLTAPFDERLVAHGFRRIADVGGELGPCAFTTLNVRTGWTTEDGWRRLLVDMHDAIRRVPANISYDLRVSGLNCLLDLMTADGIPVSRSLAEIVEGPTAWPSP